MIGYEDIDSLASIVDYMSELQEIERIEYELAQEEGKTHDGN